MKKFGKVLTSIFLILTLFTLAGCGSNEQSNANGASSGEKGKVKLGYVEWDSEVASNNVLKIALEDQGYEVELIPVSASAMWTGVAQGDFDAIIGAWLPTTHADYFAEVKDKVEDLGVNLEGTKIGLVVPSYVNINSIEELKDNADKFNSQIVGIDAGAGIMKATETAISEYGLDKLTLMDGTGATMTASLKDAIDNKEWIVVTGWTPHWKFSRWDLKYLEDPKGIYGADEFVHTIARKGLKEDNAEVYAILDEFNWTPEDMAKVMVKIENGKDPADAARAWVDDNQDKVKAWFK